MLSGGRGLSEVYLALLRVVAEEDGSLRKELRPTKKQRDLEEVARQHLHRAGRNVCRERGREGGRGRRRRVGERKMGRVRTGEREEKWIPIVKTVSKPTVPQFQSFLISLSGVCHFER